MDKPLYLGDLALGQSFASARHRLDSNQIKSFAARFDPQPFHLDESVAQGTFFRGLAASGWHVAAITMKLLVNGGLPIAGGIIGAGAELAWPQPTRPGDILRARSVIVDIKPSKSKPGQAIATVKVETRNQHDEVLMMLIVKVLTFSRPTRDK